MKKLFLLLFTLNLCCLTACKKEDPSQYRGDNLVEISVEGASSLVEDTEDAIKVNVMITTALASDATITFVVKNDEQKLVKLEGTPVTIKAGELKSSFTIVSDEMVGIDADKTLSVEFAQSSNNELKAGKPISITVKPNPQFEGLTDEQIELVGQWRHKYGVDLVDWLGSVDCKVVVKSPAGGYFAPYETAFTKEFKGSTIITLDETATAETPILKMTNNPLGLDEYFGEVFRNETILNPYNVGEYAAPYFQGMAKAINYTADSEESFSMTLSNLVLDLTQSPASINFVSTIEDSYGDEISVVPFDIQSSAYQRELKLIEEGAMIDIFYDYEDETPDEVLTAEEVAKGGGTMNPWSYMFISTITEDYWENEPSDFVAPVATLDAEKGEMKFTFSFDHYYAGGYTQIEVIYTAK